MFFDFHWSLCNPYENGESFNNTLINIFNLNISLPNHKMKPQQILPVLTKNFSYLYHPYVLTALILTALNDHYFKYKFNNFLTGKISDFAGLFFFPLLLCALVDFIKAPLREHKTLNQKQIMISIIYYIYLLYFHHQKLNFHSYMYYNNYIN